MNWYKVLCWLADLLVFVTAFLLIGANVDDKGTAMLAFGVVASISAVFFAALAEVDIKVQRV